MREVREISPFKLSRIINEELEKGMWNVLEHYAREYKRNGKNFIHCYLKFPSVRINCMWIVQVCKRLNVIEQAREQSKCKDVLNYVQKFDLSERDRRNLNDVLLMIYLLNNHETSGQS